MVMLVLIVAGTTTVVVLVFVIIVITEITIRMINTDTNTDSNGSRRNFGCWWSHEKSGPMGGCFASTTKTARNSAFSGEIIQNVGVGGEVAYIHIYIYMKYMYMYTFLYTHISSRGVLGHVSCYTPTG